eukprot:6270120-Prymnesium_polylepis.1
MSFHENSEERVVGPAAVRSTSLTDSATWYTARERWEEVCRFGTVGGVNTQTRASRRMREMPETGLSE